MIAWKMYLMHSFQEQSRKRFYYVAFRCLTSKVTFCQITLLYLKFNLCFYVLCFYRVRWSRKLIYPSSKLRYRARRYYWVTLSTSKASLQNTISACLSVFWNFKYLKGILFFRLFVKLKWTWAFNSYSMDQSLAALSLCFDLHTASMTKICFISNLIDQI